MFFLIIGAVPIFILGLFAGIGITILLTALFLSYANGIPLTQPLHICVEMYLQMTKFWFKFTRKQSRLTFASIDIPKFEKKPSYVRVLPMTMPSKEAQFWDGLVYAEKQRFFMSELKKKYNPNRVQKLRDHMAFSEPMFTLIRDNLCKISIKTVKNIKIHWIEYDGSSIDNGLILAIHGGGYVAGMPSMQYALCSELSKLTGCVCASIEYRLCPGTEKEPVTIRDSLNDCFDVYKHFVQNQRINPSKICIMGESAGGGLSLLLLQKIRDYNAISDVNCGFSSDSESDSDGNALENVQLGNPGCCWVNSPWTNLEMESESCSKNEHFDAMLANDRAKIFQRMAIGEVDIRLNKLNNSVSLKDKAFSPLFGEWNDLCPIYFMCGATEMLLDDTLNAAKKAYDEGVSVRVDIEPFMHHTFPLFLRTLPEAKYSVVRAADFIMQHLKIC